MKGTLDRPHVPAVTIRAPRPNGSGETPNILTRVEVDGQLWAVTRYSVDASIYEHQTVTLTFLADITVEHDQ